MSAGHGFRHAAESEVVLAFLRGEIGSERFGNDVRRAIVDAGGLELVRSPDLDSGEGNRARERALCAARAGEPTLDCSPAFPRRWSGTHGVLQPDELSRVRFIDYSY